MGIESNDLQFSGGGSNYQKPLFMAEFRLPKKQTGEMVILAPSLNPSKLETFVLISVLDPAKPSDKGQNKVTFLADANFRVDQLQPMSELDPIYDAASKKYFPEGELTVRYVKAIPVLCVTPRSYKNKEGNEVEVPCESAVILLPFDARKNVLKDDYSTTDSLYNLFVPKAAVEDGCLDWDNSYGVVLNMKRGASQTSAKYGEVKTPLNGKYKTLTAAEILKEYGSEVLPAPEQPIDLINYGRMTPQLKALCLYHLSGTPIASDEDEEGGLDE
jgi:hypothetical protein